MEVPDGHQLPTAAEEQQQPIQLPTLQLPTLPPLPITGRLSPVAYVLLQIQHQHQ